jgi:site-specific recombinase XerD
LLDIKVKDKDWDKKNQLLKSSYTQANYYNKKLIKYKQNLSTRLIELDQQGIEFTSQEILDGLNTSKKSVNTDVTSFIYDYIEANPDNLSAPTLKYYKSSANKWKELYPSMSLTRVKESHVNEFRKYLLKKEYKINTIHNRIKVIKKIFKHAKSKGIIDYDPTVDIKNKREDGERVFLTMYELGLLETYEPKNKTEEISRDIFLFECYTGLRISDICTLKKEEVLEEKGSLRLRKKLGKTKEFLSMKLSKKATAIFNKYVNESDNEFVFPLLKTQQDSIKYNQYNAISSRTALINKTLKVIAKEVGIQKKISTHIGRHTFSVNSITMGGDIYVLSKILGHTSIKTTEIYAKVVDDKKDELIDLWDQQ